MSYRYSRTSKNRLTTCDQQLQDVFNEVIKIIDCSILEGVRSEEDQNQLYREGKSKVEWPNSKHNGYPSSAIDAAPYIARKGIPWKDVRYFYHFAGIVMAVAHSMGVELRWGGDWDSDHRFDDQTFDDLVHFELLKDNTDE